MPTSGTDLRYQPRVPSRMPPADAARGCRPWTVHPISA